VGVGVAVAVAVGVVVAVAVAVGVAVAVAVGVEVAVAVGVAVAAGVAVAVGVGLGETVPASKEPISTVLFTMRENPEPRWSKNGGPLKGGFVIAALSPAPIAGLVSAIERVIVSPPLLANGPSCGSMGEAIVPTRSPFAPEVKPVLPSLSPIRLCPRLIKVPLTSGLLLVPLFRATILFLT
jgi:hypothetical protein